MSQLKDQRLQVLFHTCVDERADVASEGRHLTRFFLEHRLVAYSRDQEQQYAAELEEDDSFRAEYGDLQLFSGVFEDSELATFVRKMVKEFLSRPEERVGLARVLKQAGSIEGVQEEICGFVQKNWKLDGPATDGALDVIWDIKVLSRLEGTLDEIVQSSTNDVLRDHASQLLGILMSMREEGQPGRVQ